MRTKNLFLLLCLLAATLSGATNAPRFSPQPQTHTFEGGCELPAPTNFHVESSGPTWVKLEWDPTNPFNQHRIRTFRVKDSVLLNVTIVPAGINTATIPLPPLTECYSEINAICEDGSDSPYYARTAHFPTVILELIVQASSSPGLVSNCSMNTMQGGERCYFANSGVTKFRVRQVNYPVDMRNFGMERANPNHYKLRLNEPNSFGQTDYIIYCDYQNPQAFGTEYQIRRNNQIIAQFVAGFDYEIGQSFLESVFIMPGFEVVRMSPYGLGNPSDEPSSGFIRERDDHDVSSGLSATAWPNPFSETLDVVLSGDTQGPLSLQLYNLSGQVVLNQQFEAAQEYYTLSTANLSPGFYMLRVEANGVVQTLKVIKSE